MSVSARRTVADELVRRNGCRHGLPGVKVLAGARRRTGGREGWVLHTYWGVHKRLWVVVSWIPPELPPSEGNHDRYMTAAKLDAGDFRPRTGTTFSASDCVLLSDWPIICDCWLEDDD